MPMSNWKKAAVGGAVVALGLAAAVALWLPSNEALARRVAQEAGRALGVPVQVGALQWRLLPRPQVVLQDVATQQKQPLTLRSLTLVPRVWPLLSGRVELDQLVLDGGTLAQRALRELGRHQDAPPQAGSGTAQVEIASLAFRDLTWISHSGAAVVLEGEARFDPGWLLRDAAVRRPGLAPAADIVITREAATPAADTPPSELQYMLQVRLGGGTAEGRATLETRPDGGQRLTGRLSPRGVDVQAALAAFNRRAPITGLVEGETTLDAEGADPLALVQNLRTETRFAMHKATLLRFDLQRAIDTLGREHSGQTKVDRLTGTLETQNVPGQGMAIRFIDIKAQAGAFSASGSGRLHERQLQAKAAIDLVDGVVGLPMTIEGPLGGLKVAVSKAPLIGAAAGTAVLPGIGTAIGAAIGRLLGDDEPAPARKPQR